MPPTNRRDFIKLALLSPLLASPPFWLEGLAKTPAPSNRPNVIVIVFDTLSAKHMSTYGYARKTTPNLDRFASQATVFHRHYSNGNFTSPGTSALLTGANPWTQRAFNFQGTVTAEYEHASIFKVFGDAGFHRVAYTHNWLVVQLLNQFRGDIDEWKPMRDLCLVDTEFADLLFSKDHDVALTSERVSSIIGPQATGSLFLSMFARGIKTLDERALAARYKALFPRGLPTNNETTLYILEDAIDWIKGQFGQVPRPFFGYFHLLPPHEPYNPRREFIGRFDGDNYLEVAKPRHPLGGTFDEPALTLARRHYDEFLAYADSEFGRLYDSMLQSGILNNSYVVFTSDHGQMLERGTRGHQNPLLYEPITRIPLIVSSPGQTTRVDVTATTSALDLMPTLANIISQPMPKWSEGDILPTLGGDPKADRSIYTLEAKSNAKRAPLTQATVSLVKQDYKLISYNGYGKGYDRVYELYNLADDPEELVDLYGSKAATADDMRVELTGALEAVNSTSHGA